jgi:hypothetical protein
MPLALPSAVDGRMATGTMSGPPEAIMVPDDKTVPYVSYSLTKESMVLFSAGASRNGGASRGGRKSPVFGPTAVTVCANGCPQSTGHAAERPPSLALL